MIEIRYDDSINYMAKEIFKKLSEDISIIKEKDGISEHQAYGMMVFTLMELIEFISPNSNYKDIHKILLDDLQNYLNSFGVLFTRDPKQP